MTRFNCLLSEEEKKRREKPNSINEKKRGPAFCSFLFVSNRNISSLFYQFSSTKENVMIGGVFVYNHKGEILISVILLRGIRKKDQSKFDSYGFVLFCSRGSIVMILVEMLPMHFEFMLFMHVNKLVIPW